MFLRPCYRRKNGKRHAYWALMESYRTERGPRQRVVAYLGQLDERGRLGVKEAAGGRGRSRQKRLFDDVQPQWVEVDACRVRVENCRDFGGPWLGLELVRRLRWQEFLGQTIPQGREKIAWSSMALVLVLCRLCNPCSELQIAEHFSAQSALAELLGVPAEKVNEQRLYRALEALLPHKEALEVFLKERLGELFELEYELLLYDVTSTYFEGEAQANPLAQRGYSRDHRPDRKQVCIALVVSRCGMPLGYEVFAGNRADVTTVEEIVETMERRSGRADRIWVMDRGMVSEENLAFLRQGQRWYIVGTPKSMLKQFQRELLGEDWHVIRDGLEVKLCRRPDGQETFVLCRSRDRREKEKAMHARFEQRIQEGLRRIAATCQRQRLSPAVVGQRVGRLLGRNSRAAGLFAVDVQTDGQRRASLVWRKVEAWRDWAALSEGCYLLRSNIHDWSDEELWKTYIQLTEAEAAFRVQKSDLAIRPIWHQKEHRVLAHILVCFLAYVLWKSLSRWCLRAETSVSCGNCPAVQRLEGALQKLWAEFRCEVGYWKSRHADTVKRIEQLKGELDQSRGQVRALQNKLFGRKSEKSAPSDRSNDLFDPQEVTAAAKRRGAQPGHAGHGRRDYSHLPVKEEFVPLPEESLVCPHCGKPAAMMSATEDSKVLEIEVRAYRRRIRRRRYRPTCDCDPAGRTLTAPPPPKLIPTGNYGLSIWVHVLLDKYSSYRPTERLLGQLEQYDLDLPAGTVNDGLQRIEPMLRPIYEAFRERNRLGGFHQADETRWLVFVLLDGKKGHAWWLWIILGADTVVYLLDRSRGHEVPEAHFGPQASGALEVDRYSGYKAMAQVKSGLIVLAFCWAHVRRDFVGVGKSCSELTPWALSWLRRIRHLYQVNWERLRHPPDSASFQEQDALLRQTVEAMRAEAVRGLSDPKLREPCRKVLESLQEHWTGLIRFVDDPRIPMDNNASERGPAVARKNFYGSGSLWSGRLTAAMFSLLATLAHWNLNPRRWLTWYLEHCAAAGGRAPEDVQPFLPWNLSAERRWPCTPRLQRPPIPHDVADHRPVFQPPSRHLPSPPLAGVDLPPGKSLP